MNSTTIGKVLVEIAKFITTVVVIVEQVNGHPGKTGKSTTR